MAAHSVGEIWTLVLAVVAIWLGIRIHRILPRLQAWNIPPAITGGLVFACGVTVARAAFDIQITFADGIRQTVLLIFFAGVGLSAKIGALFRGGAAVAAICLATVVVIVVQNLVGVAVANSFGLDSALGLFMGSVPYLGGFGTAAAWAGASPAQGLNGALEVGVASATLGLVAGGFVAGPVVSFLARRSSGRDAAAEAADAADVSHEPQASAADLLNTDRWLTVVLALGLSLGLGELLRQWAEPRGMVVPGFLAVMLAAIVITNLADLVRRPIDLVVSDLTGTVALRLFLGITMMGLKLWELAGFLLPLLAALAAQVVTTTLVALLLVYPMLGRGYQAAVACGGFIGFALSAMPVGLAVMKRVTASLGPAPKAFLAITLAGALFADTVNAILINIGFSLLK